MGLLIAKRDEVVIVMPESQLDTNTSPILPLKLKRC